MFEGLYDENGQIPHIRNLLGNLDEDTIRRAEQRYVRYLELTWRILESAARVDDSPAQ